MNSVHRNAVFFAISLGVLMLPLSADAKGGRGSRSGKSAPSQTTDRDDSSVNIRANVSSGAARYTSQASATAGTEGIDIMRTVEGESTDARAARIKTEMAARKAELDARNAAGQADFESRRAEYLKNKAATAKLAPPPQNAASGAASNAASARLTGPVTTDLPVGAPGTVFKVVDRFGRITFTDKVPNENDLRVTAGSKGSGVPVGGEFGALPDALQSIVTKFPVTVYSGDTCAPCNQLKAMLAARGVPFLERSVRTPQDVEALQRIAGEATLPFATVGGQYLRGFSDQEVTQVLDAAEYPRTSQLPSSFRNPGAAPLVATVRAAVEAGTTAVVSAGQDGLALSSEGRAAARAAAAAAAAATAAAAAANPLGLKF